MEIFAATVIFVWYTRHASVPWVNACRYFKRGEEKYYVGETKTQKLRSLIRKHEMELKKMTELENKQSAINASKNSVSNKIESELFRLKKMDYLLNGNKNWILLRKHVYAIEQFCKQHFGGRFPAKHDISKILANALADNYSPLSYNQSRKSVKIRSDLSFKVLHQMNLFHPTQGKKSFSPILATAPTNAKEETEQLELVMRESLRSQRECGSCVMSTHNMFPSEYHAALTCQPIKCISPSIPLGMPYDTFYLYIPHYQPNQLFLSNAGKNGNVPKHCSQSKCSTTSDVSNDTCTLSKLRHFLRQYFRPQGNRPSLIALPTAEILMSCTPPFSCRILLISEKDIEGFSRFKISIS